MRREVPVAVARMGRVGCGVEHQARDDAGGLRPAMNEMAAMAEYNDEPNDELLLISGRCAFRFESTWVWVVVRNKTNRYDGTIYADHSSSPCVNNEMRER